MFTAYHKEHEHDDPGTWYSKSVLQQLARYRRNDHNGLPLFALAEHEMVTGGEVFDDTEVAGFMHAAFLHGQNNFMKIVEELVFRICIHRQNNENDTKEVGVRM